jgi:hypothetical protein|tara:strand:- start:641 stop:1036 length:396 start_codon:yes stop_codon:yes gene_type:complete
MFNMLIGPIANMVGDTVKGFVETKKAKADLALTEIKAQKSLKEQQIAGKVKWEASAVDQMKGSWKDEFVLLALMVPAICSFLPFMQPHIERGFQILETLPEYYTHLLYLACSVSLGVRAAPGIKGMISKNK